MNQNSPISANQVCQTSSISNCLYRVGSCLLYKYCYKLAALLVVKLICCWVMTLGHICMQYLVWLLCCTLRHSEIISHNKLLPSGALYLLYHQSWLPGLIMIIGCTIIMSSMSLYMYTGHCFTTIVVSQSSVIDVGFTTWVFAIVTFIVICNIIGCCTAAFSWTRREENTDCIIQ